MVENRLLKFWAGIAVLTILNLFIFDVLVFLAPDTLQVQYIPDDGYYYLSLARNFARLHIWTFDLGVSRTNGFHPLLAYLLVLCYKIFQPDNDQFVRIGLGISSIFTMGACLLIFWKGWKYQEPVILAVLAILISTRNIFINSTSSMEWPVLVFIIVLISITLIENHTSAKGRTTLFVLGLAGSLARVDFGLLVFSFMIASLIIWLQVRDAGYLKAFISTLSGAATGVGLVLSHNFLMSSQAIPSSALMKSHWAAGSPNKVVLLICAMGLLAMLIIPLLGGKSLKPANDFQRLIIGGASFTWISYSILYSRNADVLAWYSSNVLISVFIFLCVLWRAIQHGRLRKYTFMPHGIFLIIFAVCFAGNIVKTYPLDAKKSPWPNQAIFLEAGKYLHLHPLMDGRIGAWNAGIVNYYQGGNVVNLDGLVNNDIYVYAVSNSSFEYIKKTNIRYVVDYDVMFTEDFLARSGYNDPRFLNVLSPLIIFNEQEYPHWGHFTLYKVELTP